MAREVRGIAPAARFRAVDPAQAFGDLERLAKARGHEIRLAGPSAVAGSARPVVGPVVMYADAPDALFASAGFKRVVRAGAADLVVWPPTERAVLLWPRTNEYGQATNRVVTYLDLLLGGAREQSAAEAVWREVPP